jgi:hypothetical protein
MPDLGRGQMCPLIGVIARDVSIRRICCTAATTAYNALIVS